MNFSIKHVHVIDRNIKIPYKPIRYIGSTHTIPKKSSCAIESTKGIPIDYIPDPAPTPIRVAPHGSKLPASMKRKKNRFRSPLFDDRCHPDPQEEWESMLPEVQAGRLIRKRKHEASNLHDIDPTFGEEYDESKHGNMLHTELDISHLTPFQQQTLTTVVKKYWRVFSKKGVTTPVKDCECEIDRGDAQPIACKNPNFGPLETPIMEKVIYKLLQLHHIKQIYHGTWLSKPLLAAKLHQKILQTLLTLSGNSVRIISLLTPSPKL